MSVDVCRCVSMCVWVNRREGWFVSCGGGRGEGEEGRWTELGQLRGSTEQDRDERKSGR